MTIAWGRTEDWSRVVLAASSESAGPGGRLWRSRTSASSEKLLSVIEPLAPLLFLEEDIVVLRKWERPWSDQWDCDQCLRTLAVPRAEGTCFERDDGSLGFFLSCWVRQGGQPIAADR